MGGKYKQFFFVRRLSVCLFISLFVGRGKRLAAQTIFCINFNFGLRFSPVVCSAVSRYCVWYLLVDSRHSFYFHLVSSPAYSHCACTSADACKCGMLHAGSRMNIELCVCRVDQCWRPGDSACSVERQALGNRNIPTYVDDDESILCDRNKCFVSAFTCDTFIRSCI